MLILTKQCFNYANELPDFLWFQNALLFLDDPKGQNNILYPQEVSCTSMFLLLYSFGLKQD